MQLARVLLYIVRNQLIPCSFILKDFSRCLWYRFFFVWLSPFSSGISGMSFLIFLISIRQSFRHFSNRQKLSGTLPVFKGLQNQWKMKLPAKAYNSSAYGKAEKENEKREWERYLVAGAGFEPTTFGLWARRATRLLHPASETCLVYSFIQNLQEKFLKSGFSAPGTSGGNMPLFREGVRRHGFRKSPAPENWQCSVFSRKYQEEKRFRIFRQ